MAPDNFPASPSTLDENLDVMGFGDGSNVVKQIDEGLHPDGDDFVSLMVKTRVAPEAQPFVDHILARGISTGKFNMPFASGKKYNAAEALVIAHQTTQISIKGESRNEFTKVLTGMGSMIRSPFRMFGSRKSNYGNPMP